MRADQKEELENLRKQHELLKKMLEQQEQLRALQGRQEALMAMQHSAEQALAVIEDTGNIPTHEELCTFLPLLLLDIRNIVSHMQECFPYIENVDSYFYISVLEVMMSFLTISFPNILAQKTFLCFCSFNLIYNSSGDRNHRQCFWPEHHFRAE